MANKPVITPELLRQLIRYEPETGKYFWLPRPIEMFACRRAFSMWHKMYCGKEALRSVNKRGYCVTKLLNRRYFSHSVIWAFHTGQWPIYQIDHINRIKDDNRIENLRDIPQSENVKNAPRRGDNSSGVVGVRWHKSSRKWQGRIHHNKKEYSLGCFKNKQDAVNARKQAEIRFGFYSIDQ